MTMMITQELSDTARRSKFPLAYTYLAGLEFKHPSWVAYALGMTQIVRTGAANALLQGDVRRHFDRCLIRLGSPEPYGDN